QLTRLTEDHSLVDELIRQGRLTPAEAQEHPQRSVITRALGPEPVVQADTATLDAAGGDVYLVCSDGLTSMISDDAVAEIINRAPGLRVAGEELLHAANDAGGRDNITVILFRLEDVGAGAGGAGASQAARAQAANGADAPTGDTAPLVVSPLAGTAPAAGTSAGNAIATGTTRRILPRRPSTAGAAGRVKRRRRLRAAPVVALAVLGALVAGAYLATQSVYFMGTNARGFVTVYNGLPYALPGGVSLYAQYYVTGVPAATVPASRRHRLLDNSWLSRSRAAEVAHDLELETIAPR
ncbi:MAG: serine/threonine-protein phosphatase, partial [Acidobacteriota bacterium]|nr:serine/threonine-protein phosphatase [Acidobacteriota bacterium]